MRAYPKFSELKSVHIVGACGTLMGAFAAFLRRAGVTVTGSDQNVYPPMSDVLASAGVKLFSGYRSENLKSLGYKPDLVVIGNVIRSDNPEAREAIDHGYSYCSLPEFMEHLLLAETTNILACGTHGKTTTSSMLAHVLTQAGKDPSFFIGGVSQDLPHSFQVNDIGKGKSFVLEGDEYDTAFWDKVPKFVHYRPDHVILTSVEFDHADIYASLEAVVQAFERLAGLIREGGHLIACLDYPLMKRVIEKVQARVMTYGSTVQTGARFVPSEIQSGPGGTRFTVLDSGKRAAELEIKLHGLHNVLNATAVWVECRELGIENEVIARALSGFKGVKRRQEVRGVIRGVTVIDDFAHHPTAVRETLRGFRAQYPGARIIAVFEPRSATSRRNMFQKEFGEAFAEADYAVVALPYDQSRIPEAERFSSEKLVSDIKTRGREAQTMSSTEDGLQKVSGFARSGDVVAVLSNGGFDGFIPKLLAKLNS